MMCKRCLLISVIFLTTVNFSYSFGQLIDISTDQEKQIGKSIARKVEKIYEEVNDPLLQKRFENIGKKLASVCERKDLVFNFKVLKSKFKNEAGYNAFALPGGYIYIFDEFIEVLKTDERIAAVTAHEIGHITARHAIKKIQSSLGINALMALAIATTQNNRAVAEAGEALTQLMMAYSRKDEFEADRLSVKYLKRAGFKPEGALEALQTLSELRQKGEERRYMIYKSHPYLSERIARIRVVLKGYTDFDSYINLPTRRKEIY